MKVTPSAQLGTVHAELWKPKVTEKSTKCPAPSWMKMGVPKKALPTERELPSVTERAAAPDDSEEVPLRIKVLGFPEIFIPAGTIGGKDEGEE